MVSLSELNARKMVLSDRCRKLADRSLSKEFNIVDVYGDINLEEVDGKWFKTKEGCNPLDVLKVIKEKGI